jgi:hypothetical protein
MKLAGGDRQGRISSSCSSSCSNESGNCFDHGKLLMRFDPEQYGVHESAAGLATPFEHEHG